MQSATINVHKSFNGQMQSKIRNLSSNINSVMEQFDIDDLADSYISNISDNNDNSTNNEQIIKDNLDYIVNNSIIVSSMWIYDFNKGNALTDTSSDSKVFTADYKNEVWYDKTKISQSLSYFVERQIVQSSNSLFSYIHPIVDKEGNAVGVICLEFDNEYITDMLKMFSTFDSQIWAITDDSNHILFYSDKYSNNVDNVLYKMLSQLDGDQSHKTLRYKSQNYIVLADQMALFDNCRLVYMLPIKSVLKQSQLVTVIIAFLTMMSMLVTSVSIMMLISRIVKETNDIKSSLVHVANRKYTGKLEVKSNDEIGQLVKEFNSVITALKYQAEHDCMTDFWNAETFYNISAQYVKDTQDEVRCALIRLDIDNFSFINDLYSWDMGNEIIIKIAAIIKSEFADESIYGYLGRDIFLVCCRYTEISDVLAVIMHASEKIKACDPKLAITPHFGVYSNIRHDDTMNIVCDCAGTALKTIKGNLLETYAVYDEALNIQHADQKFIESQKQVALDNNQFYIVLQPKCDIDTGKVVGAEALVRWKHPDRAEPITPGKFIPIFEKNGFIITLDKYVWEETCKVIKRWRDMGYRDVPVSVNVSRMHIFNQNFVSDLAAITKKYDIPPELLELEITESALIKNIERVLEKAMTELKKYGYKLLMDDFASGYSSLIALERLPFDIVKIDKGLIDRIDETKNKQLVTGLVSLLRSLGKSIVVEGVEYEWQKEALRDTGCHIIQGFCFSRPMDVEQFEAMAFRDEIKHADTSACLE